MDEVSLISEVAAEPDVDGVLVTADAAEEKFATDGVGEEGGVGAASDLDTHVEAEELEAHLDEAVTASVLEAAVAAAAFSLA